MTWKREVFQSKSAVLLIQSSPTLIHSDALLIHNETKVMNNEALLIHNGTKVMNNEAFWMKSKPDFYRFRMLCLKSKAVKYPKA
jgi:hypothetical protein